MKLAAARRPHAIVWLHGIVSSRFECSGCQEAVLAEQNAYIIGFDRPGYGASSPHRGRTYRSYVQVSTFSEILNQHSILAEQNAYIIGFDRPGYGASSPDRGRTYRSYVQVSTIQ